MISKRTQRRIGLGVFAGIVLTCALTPMRHLLNVSAVVDHFEMLDRFGVQLFILAHLVLTVLGFPGTVLVIAGGALFGLVWGTVWSVVGATLGAIAAFLMTRYLIRDWVEHTFGHHRTLKQLNHAVSCNAMSCVLMLRFMPISPFNVVNFLLGLTKIPLRLYALGTVIGIIPGTLIYTWLGVTGMEAVKGENIGHFILALSLLGLLTLLPLLVSKWRKTSRL